MDFLKAHKKRSLLLFVVSVCLTLIPLLMNNCSTSSYDTPRTAAQASAVLSPETLKTWSDSGVVNSSGYDRLVILDVNTSEDNYNAGHIPGAHFLKASDLSQTRQEGVAAVSGMVLNGSRMDALIQKYGIDKNTTVVFTTGTKKSTTAASGYVTDHTFTIHATRAYWMFLYWGFPKEKLKLLDGTNVAWAALGYPITTEASPAPSASAYSVKDNAALRSDLRASVGEMIDVVDGKVSNAAIVDFRSGEADGSFAGKRGSTAGVFDPGSDFVVFEGHMKGAKALKWTDLLDSANNYRFLPQDKLMEKLATIGLDGTKTVYVH